MKKKDTRSFIKKALLYHTEKRPGKTEVIPTKKAETETDLSLAYSPGVAYPCLEISKNKDHAFKYTNKGNLVAVISNGSAVLGLGDIGPLSSKPVMEGKGVLFKKFAGIDVFDIEVQAKDKKEFVNTVKNISPTFGGINLEDIKAPDCFFIEKELEKKLDIPVFHDDQHGTAIISGAALMNACHLREKNTKDIKVVFNGAGAAAISCAIHFQKLGVLKKNILMCDSSGVIYKGRKKRMNPFKKHFARTTKKRTLEEALEGADVFCGLSVGNILNKKMLLSMAKNPIIFALANPTPEVDPEFAKKVRPDLIIATGRTDHPNQVNNVLGFPSIFRGALDTQARKINSQMKLAATYALAKLARQDVPEVVSLAYGEKKFSFGPDYIIPKPFDERVLVETSIEVAKAAMKTKVARRKIKDFKKYRLQLESYISSSRSFVREAIQTIQSEPVIPRIIFPEGESVKILKALHPLMGEKILTPTLLGNKNKIQKLIKDHDLDDLKGVEIVEISSSKNKDLYVKALQKIRDSKGLSLEKAKELVEKNPYYFSAVGTHLGDYDCVICGAEDSYPNCIRPLLKVLGTRKDQIPSGISVLLHKKGIFLFADTTVNINPSAKEVAQIAVQTAKIAKSFHLNPRIAMLSFTNFKGEKETPLKMKQAVNFIQEKHPELLVDGEMQADTAVVPEVAERLFPFSKIKGANVLIFPNLDSSNIAYKLVERLGDSELLGPFLVGMKKPANILQRTGHSTEYMHSIVISALNTQRQIMKSKNSDGKN